MRVIADNQKDNHMTFLWIIYSVVFYSLQIFQIYCNFMLMDINGFQSSLTGSSFVRTHRSLFTIQ